MYGKGKSGSIPHPRYYFVRIHLLKNILQKTIVYVYCYNLSVMLAAKIEGAAETSPSIS